MFIKTQRREIYYALYNSEFFELTRSQCAGMECLYDLFLCFHVVKVKRRFAVILNYLYIAQLRYQKKILLTRLLTRLDKKVLFIGTISRYSLAFRFFS